MERKSFRKDVLPAFLSFMLPFLFFAAAALTESAPISLPNAAVLAAAGLSAYLFFRVAMQASPITALLFGILFPSFSPLAVSAEESIVAAACAAFFPLVMLSLHRLAEGKSFYLLPLFFAASLFTAANLAYITVIAAIFYFTVRLIILAPPAKTCIFRIVAFVLSLASGVLLAFPRILPYLQNTDLSVFAASVSPDLSDIPALIAMLFPAAYDSVLDGGAPFLYAGILTLLFLPAYYVKKRPLRETVAMTAAPIILLFLIYFPPTSKYFCFFGDVAAFSSVGTVAALWFFLLMAERAFTESETREKAVLPFSAAGIVLLYAVIERLDPYMPETAYRPESVLKNAVSFLLTLFPAVLIPFFSSAMRTSGKKKIYEYLLVAVVALECGFSSFTLFLRAKPETDNYALTQSETSVVSYLSRTESINTFEPFYYRYRASDGTVAPVPDAGNIDFTSIKPYLRRFGADITESGQLLGLTPVTEGMFSFGYSVGESPAGRIGLAVDFGETKRGETVYSFSDAAPMAFAITALPTHGVTNDPFLETNAFCTKLTGKSNHKPYVILNPVNDNGVSVYKATPGTRLYLYDGDLISETVIPDSGVISADGILAAAKIEKDVLLSFLRELKDYSLSITEVVPGRLDGNIFTVSRRSVVLFTFPFDSVTRVLLDGEVCENVAEYDGLLTLEIPNIGYHTVVLEYEVAPDAESGFSQGSSPLAVIGGLLFLCLAALNFVLRKKEERHG